MNAPERFLIQETCRYRRLHIDEQECCMLPMQSLAVIAFRHPPGLPYDGQSACTHSSTQGFP